MVNWKMYCLFTGNVCELGSHGLQRFSCLAEIKKIIISIDLFDDSYRIEMTVSSPN